MSGDTGRNDAGERWRYYDLPEGPPMALNSVGTETRRSVLLVLHDTSQPWITMAVDWQPKGLCPQ